MKRERGRYNIYADAQTMAWARELGDGSASEGIRRAVRVARETCTDVHVLAEVRALLDGHDGEATPVLGGARPEGRQIA